MQENTEDVTTALNNSESGIPQVTTVATTGFKVRDGKEILNVFQATATLVDECTLEISEEGLKIRTMDPSHVALIDVHLPKECFEEFHFDSSQAPVKVGLMLDEFVELLKNIIPKGKNWNINRAIEFVLEAKLGGNPILHVKGEKQTASLQTVESYSSSTPLPKLNFNTEFKLDNMSTELKYFVNFVSQHEYVRLTAEKQNPTRIEAFSKSDRGEYKEIYFTENGSIKEDSLSTFSGDYLQKILKVLDDVTEEVKIQYSTKMPLRLETRPMRLGTLHFYLAPRVQD